MVQEERQSARDTGIDPRARLLAMQRKDGSTFPVLALPRAAGSEGSPVVGSFIVIIELGALQTAKRLGAGDYDLASTLQRIALELEALGLAAQMPGSTPLALGHPRLASLSNREREVLMHLVAGERVPTIAGKLFISPHTVRNHLKSIYSKLQVHSQSELIVLVRGLAS